MKRRLAAILVADVVGYSKLMGEDQTRTLNALRRFRQELFEPFVLEHNGTVVKRMGDGWIVEFASVLNAVDCALGIQKGLADHEVVLLRTGIHIGDVAFEEEDVFGDGVNIAARLEALAEPGQVLISDTAYNSLDGKAAQQFGGGKTQQLKNISRPITVWRWPQVAKPGSRVEYDADTGTLELPEKPSIAVLPFNNMSGDPEQEYFADGMTEDLITDLSKISSMFVVARNSCFVFKGQDVDIREVATRLGVRYVVEGSVRKVGSRVRINVQLIDALSGGHIWAERYDGALENVFELQDDVGAKVVLALAVRLSGDERERLQQVHTRNLDAYELYVRAKATPFPPIPERIKAAREMFEQVIDLDPDFAGGYAGLSFTLVFSAIFGHYDTSEVSVKALDLARKAVEIDDTFGLSYIALGQALLLLGRYDEALAAVDNAVVRQPNDPDAHGYRGFILSVSGEPEMALAPIAQAIRLNPQFVSSPYLNFRGFAKLMAADYVGVITAYEENLKRQGPVAAPAMSWVAAAHSAIGQHQKAAQLVAQVKDRFPDFRLKNWNFLKLPRQPEDRQRMHDLMREAGVPQ